MQLLFHRLWRVNCTFNNKLPLYSRLFFWPFSSNHRRHFDVVKRIRMILWTATGLIAVGTTGWNRSFLWQIESFSRSNRHRFSEITQPDNATSYQQWRLICSRDVTKSCGGAQRPSFDEGLADEIPAQAKRATSETVILSTNLFIGFTDWYSKVWWNVSIRHFPSLNFSHALPL